jgi:hypothetical protein
MAAAQRSRWTFYEIIKFGPASQFFRANVGIFLHMGEGVNL